MTIADNNQGGIMTIKKFLILLLLLPLVFLIHSCGKGAGSGYNPPGKGPGQPTYIKLLPSRYVAQTNGCINLYAEIHDETGERLANVAVTFSNLSDPFAQLLDRCGGTEISPPATINTDQYGRAMLAVYSTTPGFVTILAQYYTGIGHVRDQKTLYFSTYSLSLLPIMILDVDSNNNGIYNEAVDFIFFDTPGHNEALIRATVYDIYGLPQPSSVVTFGADFPYRVGSSTQCSDGSSECEVVFPNGDTATTDTNGQAFISVRVEPIAIREITVLLNITASADNGAANLVTLFLEPVIVSAVSVSADPDVVATGAQSTITAGVTLNTGLPTPDGTSVSFTTCDDATCTVPCGAVEPFAQTTDGEATAQYNASSIPDTCRVTATSAGVSGSTVIIVTDDLAVLPGSIDVNGTVGGTATFTVYNGAAPYTVAYDSADPNLAPNPVTVLNSGDTFTVTVPAGTQSGTVTYTIRDSQGNEVTARVDISTDALAVLPSSISVDGVAGSGGPITFNIYGGVPGYTVVANTVDPNLQPTLAGTTFTVTVPAGTAATSVTYTVRDSVGSTVTATLTITVLALDVQPTSATVGPFGSAGYSIIGGIGPFTVNTSHPGITLVNLLVPPVTLGAGVTTFNVTDIGSVADTNVTVTVIDSVGTTDTATFAIDWP